MKQKILIILTPGFPENEQDTSTLPYLQKFVLEHIDSKPYFELIIFSFQKPFTLTPYKWHGIQVFPFGGANSKNPFIRLKLWLNVWRKLNDMVNTNNILGIFNQWLTECSLIGLRFGRWHGIPSKSWLIGMDSNKNNRYMKWIRPVPKEIIAMSEQLNERLKLNHNIQTQQIAYNGIYEKEFSFFQREEKTIDIIGIGSLIPLKQFDQFITIIADLQKIKPNIKCLILGEGPLYENLKAKIIDLKLEKNIQLKGLLPHPEVLQLLNKSKIVLHCSRSEGNSTIFSEALRLGCYVISYPVGFIYKNEKHFIAKDFMDLKILTNNLIQQTDLNFDYQKVNVMETSYHKILNYFGIH